MRLVFISSLRVAHVVFLILIGTEIERDLVCDQLNLYVLLRSFSTAVAELCIAMVDFFGIAVR